MQSTGNYPTKSIVAYFALFGGLVGALLSCLAFGIYAGFDNFTQGNNNFNFSVYNIIAGSLAVIPVVWTFGLIPSLVTGWILVKIRATKKDGVKNFLVGAVVSCGLLLPIFYGFLKEFTPRLIFGLLFALVGGFSSVIMGKFTLPKT